MQSLANNTHTHTPLLLSTYVHGADGENIILVAKSLMKIRKEIQRKRVYVYTAVVLEKLTLHADLRVR